MRVDPPNSQVRKRKTADSIETSDSMRLAVGSALVPPFETSSPYKY